MSVVLVKLLVNSHFSTDRESRNCGVKTRSDKKGYQDWHDALHMGMKLLYEVQIGHEGQSGTAVAQLTVLQVIKAYGQHKLIVSLI